MTDKEFAEHAEKWEHDTSFMSSTTQIMAHPSAKEIINAGLDVVPCIIAHYQVSASVRWDIALQEIIGVCPYSKKNRGYVLSNRNSWVVWWRKNKEKLT